MAYFVSATAALNWTCATPAPVGKNNFSTPLTSRRNFSCFPPRNYVNNFYFNAKTQFTFRYVDDNIRVSQEICCVAPTASRDQDPTVIIEVVLKLIRVM
jgi:hypothetical protein